MIISTNAPDSAKHFEEYEKFMQTLKKARSGGCKTVWGGWVKCWMWAVCVEVSDDLQEIYGPQCWNGLEADPAGLKKAMWPEIMAEFNCKTFSTWLSCDDQRESLYTQTLVKQKGQTDNVPWMSKKSSYSWSKRWAKDREGWWTEEQGSDGDN